MLDTIHICGMPDEDTLKRLKQGGLEVNFYPAQYAEMAAETWQEAAANGSSSSMPLVLGVDPVPPPMLSWRDVAPEQAQLAEGGQVPSTDHIMQAVVQYNRRQLLAAAQHNSQGPGTDAAAAAAAGVGDVVSAAAAAAGVDGPESGSRQPPAVLVVGYVMKASREAALAAEGMMHLLPKQGVCFMPVGIDALTQQQQPHIDILLHKASDELVPLSDSNSASSSGGRAAAPCSAVGVSWSPRLLALQSWLAEHPDVCVVDPFEATAQVLDRLLLARVLQELQGLSLPGGVKARGPAFLEAACFDDSAAGLADALAAAGLQPPFIVKPRVACGVPDSHSMALVLSPQGLSQLHGGLPCPALVQEFVNHGGRQYKVYVLGRGQVFVTPRASIPDIHAVGGHKDVQQQQEQEQQVLFFDSLASLPTQLPEHLTRTPQQQQQPADAAGDSPPTTTAALSHAAATGQGLPPSGPDRAAVVQLADFLGSKLGLTLFGFDVVLPYDGPTAAATVESQQQQRQQQQPDEPAGQPQQQQQQAAPPPQQQQQQGQEMVVIDINYFPNYRGGSNTPAMFRRALQQAWLEHQQQQQQQLRSGCKKQS